MFTKLHNYRACFALVGTWYPSGADLNSFEDAIRQTTQNVIDKAAAANAVDPVAVDPVAVDPVVVNPVDPAPTGKTAEELAREAANAEAINADAAKEALDANALQEALSGGEIAGIVIGGGALLALIIGGTIYLYKWKKSGLTFTDFTNNQKEKLNKFFKEKILNKIKRIKDTDAIAPTDEIALTDEIILTTDEMKTLQEKIDPLFQERTVKVKDLGDAGYTIEDEHELKIIPDFEGSIVEKGRATALHEEIKTIDGEIGAFCMVAALKHEMAQGKDANPLTLEQEALMMKTVEDVYEATPDGITRTDKLANLSAEEWKTLESTKAKEVTAEVATKGGAKAEQTLAKEDVQEALKTLKTQLKAQGIHKKRTALRQKSSSWEDRTADAKAAAAKGGGAAKT